MKRIIIVLVMFIMALPILSQNAKQEFDNNMQFAQQGNANAQAFVGLCYMNGQGTEKDENKAFDWFMKAAQQGNAYSQFCVAWCYTNGRGTEKNEYKAFEWSMKAAQQGNADCQSNVAWCYLNGRGTKENYSKAFEWYMKAAQQGNANGQNGVGLCYINGKGTEMNVYKAFDWFTKAANQGFALAYANLGDLYFFGNGVQQSYEQAASYYQKALDGNVDAALPQLGLCYKNIGNYEKAKLYYEKGMNLNLPQAFCYMAYLYAEGKGVLKDESNAYRLVKQSINDDTKDQNLLADAGFLYLKLGHTDEAKDIWNRLNETNKEYAQTSGHDFCKSMRTGMYDGIDFNIYETEAKSPNTFAIIIANENYQEVSKVPYAINDGKIFAEYCSKTLGMPSSNISFIKDATLNNIRREINWLKQVLVAYNGDASVIVYYAGHGIPDETGKTSYILPIDGIGNDVSTGYSLQDLYSTLSSQPAKHITVFLDACFSGANRDGSMLASARGVAIKAKQAAPTGNLVVFSAAQGDETAWPYQEKQHGLFTYYLLKKIKESKGNVSLGELGEYVSTEVKRQSIVVNKKSQTPIVNASVSLGNNWKTWTLK